MRRHATTLTTALLMVCVAVWVVPEGAVAAANPIADLLKRRSDAISAFDAAAFDQTMAGAPSSYADPQRVWLRRLKALPLQRYDLVLEDDEYGDLARPKDKQSYDEVRVVTARERIMLRGYDATPTNEQMFLTVARTGSRWSVVGDTATDDLGLQSNRTLVDFGEVEVSQRDGILVVSHPSEHDAVATILKQAATARSRVRTSWPLGWKAPIVIMVPSTVDELARILQTTFELSTFVAFAASSVDRSHGYHLTGHRVFLHWPNFRKYSGSYQTQVLSHEFTHLATRDISGTYVTPIFDEGVAQQYGEGRGETTQLSRRVKNATLASTLVPAWYFLAGPSDDIYLAYEEAASFVKYLNGRFGKDAAARAYREIGRIDPDTPGTWRYHQDRVFQSLFKESYPSLERGWYSSIRKELS